MTDRFYRSGEQIVFTNRDGVQTTGVVLSVYVQEGDGPPPPDDGTAYLIHLDDEDGSIFAIHECFLEPRDVIERLANRAEDDDGRTR